MKLGLKIGIGSVAAVLLVACGQQDVSGDGGGGSAGDGEEPTIGLVMKSLGNPFFQDMQAGAEEHVDERGDLKLETVGIQSETDVAGQVEALNNLVAKGVDAIVIAPADSRGPIPPLVQADAQGIPIVNIDVKLDDQALEEAGLEVPFVGPDNVEGATQVGEVLADEIGPGGKVVILEGVSGAANATQRKEGFMAAVQEGGLELAASRSGNWETAEANTVFTNLLSSNPDIDGVMAANDSMALGTLSALESAGRLGEVEVVGFDNLPEVQPALEDGTMLATLDQFGSQQAAFGIDVAMDLLDGAEAPDWEKTPIELITSR